MSEQTFGRYRLRRMLGRGGMGEVYLARDTQLDRSVALKLLREDTSTDPGARARLRREAKALAALCHPGIVTIYEIGHVEDRDYFIAMEYVRGQSLRDHLRAGIPLVNLLAACAHPFPILSDSELAAHGAFRVVFEVPEDEVDRLRSMDINLEAASGRDHNKLAMPSLFLFDASGELLWQHVDADYRVRPRLEQILEVLGEHGFERGTFSGAPLP
jgi:hypothetical protein